MACLVREVRLARQMSLDCLAKVINMPRSTLAYKETIGDFTSRELDRIARALDISDPWELVETGHDKTEKE